MDHLNQLLKRGEVTEDVYRRKLRKLACATLQQDFGFKNFKFVGKGTYGAVVSAEDPNSMNFVAIKLIQPQRTWKGELETWPNLQHRNILSILKVIRWPHVDIFITPLLSRDLYCMIEDPEIIGQASALRSVKVWLSDIISGLSYLHSRELCHLDIKTDNVLIDSSSRAVLCDFTFLNSSKTSVRRYGVPHLYCPPEACPAQGLRVAVDGEKMDVWCFGILAFECLTRHVISASCQDPVESWEKTIHPVLFPALQPEGFPPLIRSAFPGVIISDAECNEARNFIITTLQLHPHRRPKIAEVQEHTFLRDCIGQARLETKCRKIKKVRRGDSKLHTRKPRRKKAIKGRKWVKTTVGDFVSVPDPVPIEDSGTLFLADVPHHQNQKQVPQKTVIFYNDDYLVEVKQLKIRVFHKMSGTTQQTKGKQAEEKLFPTGSGRNEKPL